MGTRKLTLVLPLLLLLGISPFITGCPKGTLTHKVIVTQHTFQTAVRAFQDAEIAEHDKGFVSDSYHIQIQQGIQKVALGGVDLDDYLGANLSTTPDVSIVKQKLDNLYALLDSIASDGLVGVKNPTSKALLEVALDGVKAIVDQALVQVTVK